MNRQIATIARYTLLEAGRTRLPQLVLATLLLLVGVSFLVQQIAITESLRMQTGFYAAGVRLAGVFIASLYVLVSMMRDFNDKGIDVALALDLPRAHYILGKLAGFLVIAACIAAAASLPLALLAPPLAALQWGVSLALELGIVTALALFCIVTFSQLVPAASFVLAFYLLARTLTAIRLISAQPVAGADSLAHQVIQVLIEGLALVMPAFDGWTKTAWLLNHDASWPELAVIVSGGLLYIALLAAGTLFDFYRKNF